MVISNMLEQQNISQYRLSKESGIGQSTISDLCSGKTSIEKCSAGTLYKIAKVLGTTVDHLLELDAESKRNQKTRISFDTFRSNVCHYIKDNGDLTFLIEMLETDKVKELYELQLFPECLYILAMIDYLSRINNIPTYSKYDDIRAHKLSKPLYTSDIILQSEIMHNEKIKEEAMAKAIPEFSRFNIIEGDIRNVV